MKRKRAKLRNHNFSLICNNCAGGVMAHDLGERFNSPTVNLFFDLDEYLLFLEHLNDFLASTNLIDDPHATTSWPVGILTDITGTHCLRIQFMHYKTFEEAKTKWLDRCTRVNYDNLFIFMESGIHTTDERVARFEALPFTNKAIITDRTYGEEYPDVYPLKVYNQPVYRDGSITLMNYVPNTLKSRRYLDEFDYIQWLNSSINHAGNLT